MPIPRVCLSVASPRRRCSYTCFALAVAGVILTACGSSPTAPSSGLPEAAPPTTASASAASLTIKITDGTLALASGIPGTVMLKGSHGFRFDGRVQSGLEPSNYCGPLDPCLPGATVPFTAPLPRLDLTGNGTVTFTLTWQPFLNGWAITYTSFDFGNGGGPE